ncbi:ankyrin repeat domain-containing protein [Dyella sp.]|uniref:ankyrin repeat domain-containing protein n=1 Tax=Dyella sp. TaxID=1869338 RepID=UPI002ED48F1B
MKRFLERRAFRYGTGLVALALLVCSVWMLSPATRLAARQPRLAEVPGKQQGEWVDAHRYDSEWFDAARAGRVDILQALADAHYPIDTVTSRGFSALILAAYNDKPEAVAYLLGQGVDACIGDSNGNTALMGALYKGYGDVAQQLMQTHCPIDQANHAGETALSFAVLFGRVQALTELVRRGADLHHLDNQGQTPMALADKQGNEASAAALKRLGATH